MFHKDVHMPLFTYKDYQKMLSKFAEFICNFQFLTHFSPEFHFYTPWKRKKTSHSLKFSGGMEMEHWSKMG